MSLPCPACGFLTIIDDCYGSYHICEVCGWEDDGVQLANSSLSGGANWESLNEAQTRVLRDHPLTQRFIDGIPRDPNWRPLNRSDSQASQPSGANSHWKNEAISQLRDAYWMASPRKNTFEIDGNDFSTLEEFFDVIGRTLIPDVEWGKNLDAFNDILSGGFGTPPEGFVIRWRNSDLSRSRLGYPETIRQLNLRLSRCSPTHASGLQTALKAARTSQGPTVFHWLVEVIQVHASDGVDLLLE